MGRCAIWRGDWLPEPRRSDNRCALSAEFGCYRAPYRVFGRRSVTENEDRVYFQCASRWLLLGYRKGRVYAVGCTPPAVRAVLNERTHPLTGGPLGGPRRVERAAAVAREAGIHVCDSDPSSYYELEEFNQALDDARAFVAFAALAVGQRVPGLYEGTSVCAPASDWCAWAPGVCLPDVLALGPDRLRAIAQQEQWAA